MRRRTFLVSSAALASIGAVGAGFWYHKWRNAYAFTEISTASKRHYDICIIGTGPAGCTLANDLIRQGFKVAMLESGIAFGEAEFADYSRVFDAYSVRGLEYPVASSRIRAIGGTSNIWTGRCPRLLPDDFRGGPYGNWPISYTDLKPYYSRAEKTLNVVGDELVGHQAPRSEALPGDAAQDITELRRMIDPLDVPVDYPPVSVSRSPEHKGPVRFADDALRLSHLPGCDLVCGASAVDLPMNGRRVEGVKVLDRNGSASFISADVMVVACGTLESNRLLLASNADNRAELGNQGGKLGTGFNEHPFINLKAQIPNRAPSDAKLLGRSYKYKNHFRDRGLGGLLLAFYQRPEHLMIKIGIEMEPSDANTVSLNADNPDAFGNPGAELKIKLTDKDQELFDQGEKLTRGFFHTLNSGEIAADYRLEWSHHHIGGMRMASTPDTGVVDKNLKVFGSENLYVASSGVFTTGGVANPTLTIVALAHRLADWLATRR